RPDVSRTLPSAPRCRSTTACWPPSRANTPLAGACLSACPDPPPVPRQCGISDASQAAVTQAPWHSLGTSSGRLLCFTLPARRPRGSPVSTQPSQKRAAFRGGGPAQAFPSPPQLTPAAGAATRYYLIHNDRLFWDDSAEYIQARESRPGTPTPSPALIPGY